MTQKQNKPEKKSWFYYLKMSLKDTTFTVKSMLYGTMDTKTGLERLFSSEIHMLEDEKKKKPYQKKKRLKPKSKNVTTVKSRRK